MQFYNSVLLATQIDIMSNPPSLLDRYHYFFKGILGYDPTSAWNYCKKLQEKWNKECSRDSELMKCMNHWRESKSLHLVWVSDQFSGKVPSGLSEKKTYILLSESYTKLLVSPEFEEDSLKRMIESAYIKEDEQQVSQAEQKAHKDRDAEKDRGSEFQLKQHLKTLVFLIRAAEVGISLSENLIKLGHRFLMEGLYTEDKHKINAGEYRTCLVSDGMDHLFIHHQDIPDAMSRLISKHNSLQGQDPFERASWLLVEFLTIHPFEDGNGRMSRLLWCYSLMSDGLPFPLTPFPGISKAYKKYNESVKKDRDHLRELNASSTSCKSTTSLTIVSITKVWMNFLSNLRLVSPDKHDEIIKWLKENKIMLDPISTSAGEK